jgi:hypothetical protein
MDRHNSTAFFMTLPLAQQRTDSTKIIQNDHRPALTFPARRHVRYGVPQGFRDNDPMMRASTVLAGTRCDRLGDDQVQVRKAACPDAYEQPLVRH